MTDPRDGRDNQAAGSELPGPVLASPLERRRLMSLRDASFEQAVQALPVVDAAQAGIGFKLIEHAEDKGHLVGRELLVLPGWQVNRSDKIPGRYFTSCYVKTRYPVEGLGNYQEFILNDGSTGIAQQLADLRERNEELAAAARARGEEFQETGVHCRHGLQRNQYTVMDKVFNDLGEPVIDPITRKQATTPRLDPVTNEKIIGVTYRLDTKV